METWRVVVGVMVLLAMGLIGVALATNFRRVTEWHMRRSMATASVLRRVPPWRWFPDAQYDERLARFVLLERAIGAIFAAASLMFLIVFIYGVLSGDPMPSSR